MKKLTVITLLSGVLLGSFMSNIAFATMIKPNVTILATGGTIAGSSASLIDTTDYAVGSLSIDSLISAVPNMADVATVKGEQTANIISSDVNSALLLKLSKRIHHLLTNESQDGVVVTHGTDTLEETAFFLDLTVDSEKPVVLVGAMRPASAISADGPMNLLAAVTLAADPAAQKRGALVVMDDRISSAFYVSKVNSTTPDAFKALDAGYLGVFVSGKPKFYFTPAQATDKVFFDVSQIDALPPVDILYTYQGQDASMLHAAIKNGAKGIVLAGSGNGNLSTELEKAVKKLQHDGFPIVVSTRTGSGYVSPKNYAISAGFLNPQKSRILLQLALAIGADSDLIATYFDYQH